MEIRRGQNLFCVAFGVFCSCCLLGGFGCGLFSGESLGGCAVLRRLGQGGVATVYLAKQAGLDREVALAITWLDDLILTSNPSHGDIS